MTSAMLEGLPPNGAAHVMQLACDEAVARRIADIIVAVDEPIKATRCRSDSAKGCLGRTGRCLTHDLWEELGRQIEVFLESVTLADVLERRVLGRARAAGAADSSHAAAA